MKKLLYIILISLGLVGVGISAWVVSSSLSQESSIVEPVVDPLENWNTTNE